MKLMTLNVNCFGGSYEHREEYKKKYGNRWYNKHWDELDKLKWIESIFCLIRTEKPDYLAFQEFEISSNEAQNFIKEINKDDYIIEYEDYTNSEVNRPSMTVVFTKDIQVNRVNTNQKRNLRSCMIEYNGLNILATHIPPKPYDNSFWLEIKKIVSMNMEKGIIVLGDFNTINRNNWKQCEKLGEIGLLDVLSEGNSIKELPTCLNGFREDRFFLTEDVQKRIKKAEMINEPIEKEYSDHAAIILEVE